MKKKLAALALLLAMPSVAGAKGIYVSHGGTGDGTSCASARDEAWVTTSTNWGTDATDIGDGDYIWLCDDGGTLTDVIALVGGAGKTYYISPAPGEAPNVGPTGQYGMHAATANRGTFIIDGLNTLNFSGGVGANATPLRFNSQTGFKVLRCQLNTSAYYAMQAYVSAIDAADVEIGWNTFNLGDTTDAIRVTHVGASGMTYHDWNIHDNHTVNAKNFFLELPDAAVHAADLVAYGINFDGNTADNIMASFFSPGSGIGTNGGTSTSYIGYNVTNFCGSTDYTTNNCYQGHHLGDADGWITIEHNIGYHTYNGDTGDGNFMIFDHTNVDPTLYSQNLIIQYNKAYDYSGSGFSAYRLKNSIMRHNIANGNSTATTPAGDTSDSGFKFAWSEGTGNSAYNNTSWGHAAGAAYKIADAANIGNPEVSLVNNIGAESLYGVLVQNNSTVPAESYNAFSSPASGLTYDATDITTDPLLDSAGRPRLKSLYDAGTAHDNVYCGPGEPIGAYELCKGVSMPPPLWFLGTPDSYSLGGGRLHFDYIYYGAEQVFYGAEPIWY